MPVSVARDIFIFILVIGGLALPITMLVRQFEPLERLTIGIAASVILTAGFSFAIYLLHLDPRWHWILASAGLLGGTAAWRHCMTWLQLPEIRNAAGQWLLFLFWNVGWLVLIFSYSGGGWAGDWQEHYERSLFFNHHWPIDYSFIGAYPLTARPPLANLAIGAFLAQTSDRFTDFQVFTLLLNTLIFFPTVLFARLWGAGVKAAAWVTVVLMLNPLLVQNVTFAWTKLIAAFFTVTSLYFLARDVRTSSAAGIFVGWTAMAASLLTHYSAGPWLIAFGLAWLWVRRSAFRDRHFLGVVAATIAICSIFLAGWFGWAWHIYGGIGTLTANSTVAGLRSMDLAAMAQSSLVKLWCTLVPHPLRWDDMSIIDQTNTFARLRDWFFCLYQLNLPLAFGFAGLFLVLRTFCSKFKTSAALNPQETIFWSIGVAIVIPLGVAVIGTTDTLGLTHICLQPLVVLGLARAAVQLDGDVSKGLSRLTTCILVVCWLVDGFFGLVLHFSIQAFQLTSGHTLGYYAYSHGLNFMGLANFAGKLRLEQPFIYDVFPLPHWTVFIYLFFLITMAFWLTRRPESSLLTRHFSDAAKNSNP